MALRTIRQGKTLVIELNRPAEGNALDLATQAELAGAWRELDRDPTLIAGVLHGSGGVFSIGHDRQELLEDPGRARLIPPIALFPFNVSKPVIAAIEGPSYGLGFELALACDLRIAAEGSMCGFPDRHLLVPYRVGSVLLPRLTFLGLALSLVLTGEVLTATQLQDARLAGSITPSGGALASAMKVASKMAQCDPGTLRKTQVWEASGRPLSDAMHLARSGLL